MRRLNTPLALTGLLAAAAVVAGCVLVAGDFQTLILHFATQRAVDAGESLEVHSSVYPQEVKLRKYFVRIAGRLIVAEGSALPSSVEVTVLNEDLDSGRTLFRFKTIVKLADDGSFSTVKRYRKDIAARTLQTVTVTPKGAGIPSGSDIHVCVDVVKSRQRLAERACDAADGSDGGGDGNVFVIKVLDNAFEPRLVRIEPGDTVRWVLEGSSTNHTTTEMEMVWDSGFTLTQTGDTFEWTATEQHLDQTFGYACVTHRGCCQMTGSIQVGANAPDPGDGY